MQLHTHTIDIKNQVSRTALAHSSFIISLKKISWSYFKGFLFVLITLQRLDRTINILSMHMISASYTCLYMCINRLQKLYMQVFNCFWAQIDIYIWKPSNKTKESIPQTMPFTLSQTWKCLYQSREKPAVLRLWWDSSISLKSKNQ